MAELNDLLQEAIQRCGDLQEGSAEAAGAIEGLVEQAEGLADVIESAGGQTSRLLVELTAKLEEAQDTIKEAGQEAEGSLEALVARSTELEGRAGELLEAVRTGMDELEAAEKELDKRLEQEMDAVDADTQQLMLRMSDQRQALGKNLDAASQAMRAYTEAVDTAQREWDQKVRLFLDAMDEMEAAVREQLGDYCTEIEDLLDKERADVLVQRLANELLIHKHNEAVDLIEARFEVAPRDEAPAAMEALLEALQQLERLCGEHEQALGETAGAMRSAVAEAIGIVDAMTPVLDGATQIA